MILLLVSLLAGCINTPSPVKAPGTEESFGRGGSRLVIKTIGNTSVEEFSAAGITALEMLMANHEVKLGFGKSIYV